MVSVVFIQQLQKRVAEDAKEMLIDAISSTVHVILVELQTCNLLSSGEAQVVNAKTTNGEKAVELLHMLTAKDDFLIGLVRILKRVRLTHIADQLERRYRERRDEAAARFADTATAQDRIQAVAKAKQVLAKYYVEHFSSLKMIHYSKKEIPLSKIVVPLEWGVEYSRSKSRYSRAQGRAANRIREYKSLLQVLLDRDGLTEKCMLVLGDPGYGKTTFSKKLCYDWATSTTTIEVGGDPLCAIELLFVVFCRNINERRQKIVDFVSDFRGFSFEESTIVKRWISENPSKVLFVFDGFDELPAGSSCDELSSILFDSNICSPDFPIVLTSRPKAVEDAGSQFRVRIRGFANDELQAFVANYFSHDDVDERKQRELQQQTLEFIESHSTVGATRSVLKCPLLLTFICYLAAKGRDLPDTPTGIFVEICRSLHSYDKEHCRSTGQPVDDVRNWRTTRLVEALSSLAYSNTIVAERVVFGERDLAQFSVNVVDAVRVGYLVADAPSEGQGFFENLTYSFLHKAFQEFFAALYVNENVSRLEQQLSDIGGDEHTLTSNDQVLVFLGGLCDKAECVDALTRFLRLRFEHAMLMEKSDYVEYSYSLGSRADFVVPMARALGLLLEAWLNNRRAVQKLVQLDVSKLIASAIRENAVRPALTDYFVGQPTKFLAVVLPFLELEGEIENVLNIFYLLAPDGTKFVLMVFHDNTYEEDYVSVSEIPSFLDGTRRVGSRLRSANRLKKLDFRGSVTGFLAFLACCSCETDFLDIRLTSNPVTGRSAAAVLASPPPKSATCDVGIHMGTEAKLSIRLYESSGFPTRQQWSEIRSLLRTGASISMVSIHYLWEDDDGACAPETVTAETSAMDETEMKIHTNFLAVSNCSLADHRVRRLFNCFPTSNIGLYSTLVNDQDSLEAILRQCLVEQLACVQFDWASCREVATYVASHGVKRLKLINTDLSDLYALESVILKMRRATQLSELELRHCRLKSGHWAVLERALKNMSGLTRVALLDNEGLGAEPPEALRALVSSRGIQLEFSK